MERPGHAVVPARLLLDVARALPEGDVSLELRAAEQDVEILSGGGDLPPAHAAGGGLPAPAGAG